MSIQALSWAFKQNVEPLHKFVLVALADYANDRGLAYPSVETLMRKTNLSRSTVNRGLKSVCEKGFLTDTGKCVGRTQQIKVYRLALAPELEIVSVRHTEPLREPLEEPKSTKLSEVIEILKEDPRYDGLDIDLELEKAVAWRKKKNMGVSERFLRYWLDNADRDLEGDDDEELYVSEAYYSWEGWTDARVRALRELWPGAAEPPQRWDALSRNLQELIETRVKEGWT